MADKDRDVFIILKKTAGEGGWKAAILSEGGKRRETFAETKQEALWKLEKYL